MNNTDYSAFLAYVRNYVAANPEVGAYINDMVAQGINDSRKDALNRAADMETALCVALAKRYNGREEFILSTLKKWQGKAR